MVESHAQANQAFLEEKPRLAILITCHNRRETTLRALAAVERAISGCADYKVFLVDDGSQDGTAEAIADQHPDVIVIKGSGDLYWNGGMRLAWQNAIPTDPDFFLWLNDDVFLFEGSLRDLMREYSQHGSRTIVVGRTVDPGTKYTSYGGFVRESGPGRFKYRHLSDDEQHCDTMNGNCVLIPRSAVAEIGINSDRYTHAFGDLDYGFRASRSGYNVIELKSPVAALTRNVGYETNLNSKTWKHVLFHPKGVPWRPWLYFAMNYGGVIWPAHFILLYLNMTWIGALRNRNR